MATYGLKDLYYAVITDESEESTTYDTPKKLASAMNVDVSRTTNRANLRGDNAVKYTASSKGPASITLGTTELPKSAEAELLGKTVAENGLLVEGAEDKAPYVAIGFRADDARGGYKYVWIYRIQFAQDESNYETKQETPTFQTPTITGESVPRLDTGGYEGTLWDGDESVTDQSIFDEWFDSVIDESWTVGV